MPICRDAPRVRQIRFQFRIGAGQKPDDIVASAVLISLCKTAFRITASRAAHRPVFGFGGGENLACISSDTFAAPATLIPASDGKGRHEWLAIGLAPGHAPTAILPYGIGKG